jgi:U3 small nucleolar RNA-associated protein 21
VDNLNQFVITGASDGKVKFWSFKAKALVKTINLREGVARFHSHRESSMVCVALEDFSLNILDGDTKVVVRRFVGHTAEVTDTCFSPDSRWLVSASMDCTIKVWDIPSAYLVDNFKVANACISLSMSPTGDFLSTAHVDYLGIYLWANKTLFNHISLRALSPDAEPFCVDLPTTAMEAYELDEKMASVDLDADEGEGELIDAAYTTPEQLADDLVTMSTAAASRWQNLLNLDTVKKRNRPKAAPVKPKQAPFFLPTVSGLDFKFDVAGVSATDDGSHKLLRPSTLENFTKFGRLLKATTKNDDDFEAPIAHLLALGPSAIDFEIKSLAPIGGGSLEIMQQFMKLLIHMLQTNRHFELAQSYLGVFLQTHDRVIVESPELRDYLDEVEQAQLKGWKCLEDEFLYGIGVVSNLRNFVA